MHHLAFDNPTPLFLAVVVFMMAVLYRRRGLSAQFRT